MFAAYCPFVNLVAFIMMKEETLSVAFSNKHLFGRKYYLFLVALFLLCFSPVRGNNPKQLQLVSCLLSTAQFGGIEKIVCSDTATVVHLRLVNARLRGGKFTEVPVLHTDRGDTLPVRSMQGLRVGEEYSLEAQESLPLCWIFPPLPKGTKTFDLCGMFQDFGAFGFYGISAGKPYKPLFARPRLPKDGFMPAAAVKRGEAVVRLHFLGYRKGMPKNISYVYRTPANGMEEMMYVYSQTDGQGATEARIPLVVPTSIQFNLGNGVVGDLWASPGDTTRLEIDMAAYYDRHGRMLGSDTERTNPADKGRERPAFRYGGYLADWQNYNTVHHLDQYGMAAIEELLGRVAPQAQADSLKATGICLQRELEKMKLPAAWRRFLQAQTEVAVAMASDLMLSPADSLLPALSACPSLNDPMAPLFYYYTDVPGQLPPGFFPRFAARHGVEKGSLFDMRRLIELGTQLYHREPLRAAQKEALKQVSPGAAEALLAQNAALEQHLVANRQKDGYEIVELSPEVTAADEILRLILEPLHGKTVVVDVWETWCRPCLMAHQSVKPLKEEMKNCPVAWLYISGPTSPEPIWNDMICDIPGRHIRLNKQQSQAFSEKFSIQGVPTFLVFDGEGRETFRRTGYPGTDSLREEIQRNLNP